MQYHLIVCIDRSEYLDPHAFGDGRRLRELSRPGSFVMCALAWLMAGDNGRGAGDVPPHPLVGRWSASRVVIAGDYGPPGEQLPEDWTDHWEGPNGLPPPPNLYRYILAKGTDISRPAAAMLAAEPELAARAEASGREELLTNSKAGAAQLLELQGDAIEYDPADLSMFEVDE